LKYGGELKPRQQTTQDQTHDYLKHVYCVRACKNEHNVNELMKCAMPECKKYVHTSCFINGLGVKNTFDKLDDHVVVCSKTCYKVIATTRNYTWENDGINGPDDPVTSVSLGSLDDNQKYFFAYLERKK
jgi:hypothetical protein